MTTKRLAAVLAALVLCAVACASTSARADRKPWKERRIGAKLRGLPPYLSGRYSEARSWKGRGGASLAISAFDWVEVEGGAAAIRGFARSGVQGWARLGLTPPLFDGREARGTGLLLQGLAYFGYDYHDLDAGEDAKPRDVDTFESVAFDAGAELTYWLHLRFGICMRALFDVALPAFAERGTSVNGGPEAYSDLPKDPLIGWTGTLGIAF